MPLASSSRAFALGPPHKSFAWAAIVVGILLLMVPIWLSLTTTSIALLSVAALSIIAGVLYLKSPAWTMRIIVHDDGLELLCRGERRFYLGWLDIIRVVATPDAKVCFVDGGHPDRSFVVPGTGASAPYIIEDAAQLYDHVLANTPDDRVIITPWLDKYHASAAQGTASEDTEASQ